MGNIEKIRKIKKEALSRELYFQSLLDQALGTGLLSDTNLEKIQFDCLSLLTRKTKRYTSGDSSSVPVEIAQSLLASIMFTVGTVLKTYPDPDDAVEALRNEGTAALYQKGRDLVDEMIKETKQLHSDILKHLFHTKNVFYASTIVDGINGFFKLYSPEFAAQKIHITADYPVHHPMERLLGIEFIRNYLECIYYENLFCTRFTAENIHHMLCGYDEHYETLLFNIYESVLTVAIGCILTDCDAHRLELTPASNQILYDLFQGKSKPQITEILAEAAVRLVSLLAQADPANSYILKSLPQIAAAIENAVHLQTLDRIFLIPKYPKNNPKLMISFGEKMEDTKYRRVLEKIMQCVSAADKKDLVLREIHSLADLEDILLDAELNEEESHEILGELSTAEVAALIKKHPLTSASDSYGLRESEIALCECLRKYVVSLPLNQQNSLKEAAEILDITEDQEDGGMI